MNYIIIDFRVSIEYLMRECILQGQYAVLVSWICQFCIQFSKVVYECWTNTGGHSHIDRCTTVSVSWAVRVLSVGFLYPLKDVSAFLYCRRRLVIAYFLKTTSSSHGKLSIFNKISRTNSISINWFCKFDTRFYASPNARVFVNVIC